VTPEPTTTSEARPREGIALDRLSDRVLLSHAANDEAAFGELVRRYREPLRRHAARYVGEADAEDVVQQALVNANLALRRDPERDIEPRPWLYKVTTNAAIDYRRARAARPLGDRIHEEPDFDTVGAPDSDDPHQVVAGRETVRALVTKIQGLAPNQRRAATARFLEGRSHDEIAGELGVSKGAARELIHRARRNLREAIPALAPVTLIEKLRHAVGGLFAGSSAPVAKLAAGAAAVAVAAGGGAAVIASRDDGGADRAGAAAEAASAAAASEESREPAGSGGDAQGGSRDGNGGGAGGGEKGSRDSAKSGQDGGGESAPSGAPEAGATAATSTGTAPVVGGGSNPVQSTADQLGVGNVTEQLPVEPPDLPPVPDVTDQLPVKPPSLPPIGDPLGGGG
jgi:RNA polymerase sigma-70 factor (ECF subfamily)